MGKYLRATGAKLNDESFEAIVLFGKPWSEKFEVNSYAELWGDKLASRGRGRIDLIL